jgi:hypothetical protein
VSHLRVVEERLEGDHRGSSDDQLLLTEEQWKARKRQLCGGGSDGKSDGP